MSDENYKKVLLDIIQNLDSSSMDEGTYLRVCNSLKRLYEFKNNDSDDDDSYDSDETTSDDVHFENWITKMNEAVEEDSVEKLSRLLYEDFDEDAVQEIFLETMRNNSIDCFFYLIDSIKIDLHYFKINLFLNNNCFIHILKNVNSIMIDYLKFKRGISKVKNDSVE